jgi:hypothetical protein
MATIHCASFYVLLGGISSYMSCYKCHKRIVTLHYASACVITLYRPLSSMNPHMIHQITFFCKDLVADLTAEWHFFSMNPYMSN